MQHLFYVSGTRHSELRASPLQDELQWDIRSTLCIRWCWNPNMKSTVWISKSFSLTNPQTWMTSTKCNTYFTFLELDTASFEHHHCNTNYSETFVPRFVFDNVGTQTWNQQFEQQSTRKKSKCMTLVVHEYNWFVFLELCEQSWSWTSVIHQTWQCERYQKAHTPTHLLMASTQGCMSKVNNII